METDVYSVSGVIQVLNGEHREFWLEPTDGQPRLIVHPRPYNHEILSMYFVERQTITVQGQLLPKMRLVVDATVTEATK